MVLDYSQGFCHSSDYRRYCVGAITKAENFFMTVECLLVLCINGNSKHLFRYDEWKEDYGSAIVPVRRKA